jgi:serine protease Do
MISNISRRPEYIGPRAAHGHTPLEETIHHLGTLLQVDTRLNLGMSGGALVNLRGELVGITTSMAALLGYEKSVGYAIPIDAGTMRIINTLREGKEVEYGFLGVSIGPLVDRRELRQFQPRPRPINGVHIDVLPNSPAARAGLMNNDYITAVNDVPIHDRVDLTREVGKLPPGAKVELRVARASATEPVKLSVELGKWPVVDDEGIIAPQRSAEAWRGLIVDYPTARLKYYTDVTRYPTGVLVTDVLPASRGAGADLVPGNYIYRVNGEPVSKPADFYAMVRGNKGDVVLDLADEPKENRRVVIRADSP